MTDQLPVIVLPYVALVPDNKRIGGAAHRGAKHRLTDRYRVALDACRMIARAAWKKRLPLPGPVVLEIRFYVPDRRKRDVSNLLKEIHDAFTGIVYCDDEQIRHETWIKVGVDRLQPRAEVTVYAYEVPAL